MWTISAGIKLIARGGSINDYDKGSHFLSEDSEVMQYAVYSIDKEMISRHVHKPRNRQGKYPTHEFFIVWCGTLLVTFYTMDKQVISSKVLHGGDFFCQHSGGHGFESLEYGTVFMEVKHGPFLGVEIDKIKF